MRPRACLPCAAAVAIGALLLAAQSAPAAFTPAQLVSSEVAPGRLPVQADYAYSPAISADGRYVAFTGSVNSVRGVYRRDLQTGELQLVAGGDASAPSISAEGRYISFTTSQNPTGNLATEEHECSAVWVHDMEPGPGEPAYELASALNGSGESLSYAGTGKPDCPGGGSAAADRVALSADGRVVAFTVIGESDLSEEMPGADKTPPDQVAVRNLQTHQTMLVSASLASQLSEKQQPPPTPAAVAGSETLNNLSTWVEEEESHNPIGASTAAISGDGSTVAWMGEDIPAQAPVAAGYATYSSTKPDSYVEPLWRRISGPPSPTRRITGGDDPQSPTGLGPLDLQWSLGTSGADENGPEYGTFIRRLGFGDSPGYHSWFDDLTPQLSYSGEVVAILCTAPAYGAEPVYPPGTGAPSEVPANAYVVNMAPGLTRSQALTPLTEWASINFGHSNTALSGAIEDIAISPEGTRVAFVTQRAVFPLAPPALITPTVTEASFAQLYVVDLRAGTLALAIHGYEGGEANGNIYSPSFSGDGNTIAFASSATNLTYGTVGEHDTDVYAISAETAPAVPGQQLISPLPAAPLPVPEWRIGATAQRGPDGSLLVDVLVPGSGTLSASAGARVPRERTLASAHTATSKPGLVQLRLLPAGRYRSLERSRAGLWAQIAIDFAAPGHRQLKTTLQAAFHLASPAKKQTGKRRVRSKNTRRHQR
jgi:dipeptidyl aminopeptidase/acylaminoacyl peptidase